MDDQNKQLAPQPIKKSALSTEKTFGEKAHSFVFDNLLNFWANLILSGIFNHWVHNRAVPLKIFGDKTPWPMYKKWREMTTKAVGGSETVGNAMANAFTLSLPGHVVVIPSVWLGAKVKTPMVRWLDNLRYGQDKAEHDARIQERHYIIEHEDRSNIWGAIVGRIGSAFAIQLASFTVGGRANIFNMGYNKIKGTKGKVIYPGVDDFAGDVGHSTGDMMTKTEKNANRFIKLAKDMKMGWSPDQMDEFHKNPNSELSKAMKAAGEKYGYNADGSPVYTHFLQDLNKYIGLDVLYTAVSTVAIYPIINAVKKVVPGLTYKPKAEENPTPPPPIAIAPEYPKGFEPKQELAKVKEEQTAPEEKPASTVSQIASREPVRAPEAGAQAQV